MASHTVDKIKTHVLFAAAKLFLETAFLIFRVPDEKIREVTEFVAQFDFTTLARKTIDNVLQQLVNTDIS